MGGPYPPIVWSTPPPRDARVGVMGSELHHTLRRATNRVAADPHVVLAVAIVFAALVIEVIAGADALGLVAPSAIYLTIQTVLALSGPAGRSAALDTARLLIALAVVFWMTLRSDDLAAMPLSCLYLLIVGLAAVQGTRQAIVLGAAAMSAFMSVAISSPAILPGVLHRGVALAVTMIVLAIGARRTVASLERAIAHARAASAGQRRRASQMAAVEAVGRALTAKGPTQAALEDVMDLLVAHFDYRFASIYTVDGPLMRLGAQRGYDEVIESFDGSIGVVGRVMRTGEPELVLDVSMDPDYAAANADVCSEVTIPLAVDGTMLGVLNIESGADVQLDDGDLDTMIVVGDRVAVALALGRERQALQERAALFGRLARFGSALHVTLEPMTPYESIIGFVADLLYCDVPTL